MDLTCGKPSGPQDRNDTATQPDRPTMNPPATHPAYLTTQDCRLEDLAHLVQNGLAGQWQAHLPQAGAWQHGVPIYDGHALRSALTARTLTPQQLMAEWAWAWRDGPGVLVIQQAFAESNTVDRVTRHFQDFIQEGRQLGHGADHFAKPGANDRVWNALEKLAVRAPQDFVDYYGNPLLSLAYEAWLGPAYQVTSQVNCVNPGGAAQVAHRDYHLGFLTAQRATDYPLQVHQLSPFLTLQGAVAHVDMPLESGPTLYLPHSQKYQHGYLVAGVPAFQSYFDQHRVQLPLRKGDAVFFNPALIHAAGANRSTDHYRLGNLLQVSSAFGRAMETVDRVRMALALYPTLLAGTQAGTLTPAVRDCAIAASAEGYAFPTNLDLDPPRDGLAPPSQQDLIREALAAQWPFEQFQTALEHRSAQRQSR